MMVKVTKEERSLSILKIKVTSFRSKKYYLDYIPDAPIPALHRLMRKFFNPGLLQHTLPITLTFPVTFDNNFIAVAFNLHPLKVI